MPKRKHKIIAQVQVQNLANEKVVWHVIVQGEVMHSFRTRDEALRFLQAYTGEPARLEVDQRDFEAVRSERNNGKTPPESRREENE